MTSSYDFELQKAADIVKAADTLFILAGAGLSAEVGIPTYWSENGSYGEMKSKQGYTALQHSDASLWMKDTVSQIEYFQEKQAVLAATNFEGSVYATLLDAVAEKDYFCVTSNVDSAFHRVGFGEEKIFEVHGSYRQCQCIMDPGHGLFPSMSGGSATCSVCSMPTRPNALFFNDNAFNPLSLYDQQYRFNRFVDEVEEKLAKDRGHRVAMLELGVGSTVPRVRQIGNRLYRDLASADYLHVNVEPQPEFLFGEACSFENKEKWLQMTAKDLIHAL